MLAAVAATCQATTVTRCARGQEILSSDGPPHRVHIVTEGRIRVYRMTRDGKQLTLDIVEPGAVLGLVGLSDGHELPEAYAEALEDVAMCTITPDDLRELIMRHPTVGLSLIRHLMGRLRSAERELEAMAYERVDQRLARKLLDLARRFGVATERGTAIDARLTQQGLAEMVGTTRETLAHALADFRRRDLIDVCQHQFVVRDAQRLADIAGRDADA
jgi:CRP/FNR family transcriptional regulator, cyclic AMP receptor protein